jgi:hypothetical protein
MLRSDKSRHSGRRGCDAAHRASNSDTHLTHGCIQLFRHFSRVRLGCAGFARPRDLGNAPVFESAFRTLAVAAS